MKKFTNIKEENINENKVYNRYMDLSDKVQLGLKEILKKEGYEISEGDKLDSFLIDLSEQIAKGVVDPNTVEETYEDGEQTEMDFKG